MASCLRRSTEAKEINYNRTFTQQKDGHPTIHHGCMHTAFQTCLPRKNFEKHGWHSLVPEPNLPSLSLQSRRATTSPPSSLFPPPIFNKFGLSHLPLTPRNRETLDNAEAEQKTKAMRTQATSATPTVEGTDLRREHSVMTTMREQDCFPIKSSSHTTNEKAHLPFKKRKTPEKRPLLVSRLSPSRVEIPRQRRLLHYR